MADTIVLNFSAIKAEFEVSLELYQYELAGSMVEGEERRKWSGNSDLQR